MNAMKRSKRSFRYRQDEKEESDGVGGQEKTKRKDEIKREMHDK